MSQVRIGGKVHSPLIALGELIPALTEIENKKPRKAAVRGTEPQGLRGRKERVLQVSL